MYSRICPELTFGIWPPISPATSYLARQKFRGWIGGSDMFTTAVQMSGLLLMMVWSFPDLHCLPLNPPCALLRCLDPCFHFGRWSDEANGDKSQPWVLLSWFSSTVPPGVSLILHPASSLHAQQHVILPLIPHHPSVPDPRPSLKLWLSFIRQPSLILHHLTCQSVKLAV